MGRRMQPRNENFFTLFSKAGLASALAHLPPDVLDVLPGITAAIQLASHQQGLSQPGER